MENSQNDDKHFLANSITQNKYREYLQADHGHKLAGSGEFHNKTILYQNFDSFRLKCNKFYL